MKVPPPPPLKPLDLSPGPHRDKPLSPLSPHDLDPARRLMKPGLSEHEQLQKQAQLWVGQTFFGTLLKQMENSPFRSELFSGGRGGQTFTSMYHQHLVQRMTRTAGRDLANSIVRRIESRSAREDTESRPGASRKTHPLNHDPNAGLPSDGKKAIRRPQQNSAYGRHLDQAA